MLLDLLLIFVGVILLILLGEKNIYIFYFSFVVVGMGLSGSAFIFPPAMLSEISNKIYEKDKLRIEGMMFGIQGLFLKLAMLIQIVTTTLLLTLGTVNGGATKYGILATLFVALIFLISKHSRRNIVEMVYHAKSGHPGGSLSIADLLTVLYFEEMKLDSSDARAPKRDRFVLSKGHAAPAIYATLMEKGYVDKALVTELRKFGSPLQGHPDLKKLPGIDMSTGSLGQGLSAAQGMAISAKISNDDFRVYAILGDGELQEGQVWEAFMSAPHFGLDNLVAIVDSNDLQIDGNVSKVMPVEPLTDKFKSFNWHVINIDGHNFEEIRKALEEARNTKGKPTVIIAKTVKGKGVSFMENNAGWHGKAPNKEEFEKAMEELK